MSFVGFIVICFAFIIVLIGCAIYERTSFFVRANAQHNALNTKHLSSLMLRGVYIFLFAALACAATSMVNNYIYPTDENIFKNVDYHVLSHKGYEIGKEFYLAKGSTYNENGEPEKSLLDSKDGVFLINRTDSCFEVKGYTDPIYVLSGTAYQLVNAVVETDVSKGFKISSGSETLTFTIKPEMEDGLLKDSPTGNYLYISNLIKGNSSITDTSTFKSCITLGYPLLDIITKSPRITISENLEKILEGTLLARKKICVKENRLYNDNDERYLGPLCIMPGAAFYENRTSKINGDSTYSIDKRIVVKFKDYIQNDKVEFFSGLGKSKTETFQLSYLPEERMRLEFSQKDMKPIKDTLGYVFINSSLDEVAKESLGGGYLYNKFEYEENVNHIRAHFQYKSGNARQELAFKVHDLNISNEKPSSLEYKSNNEFLLHSRGETSWIFEIKDLRATCDLQSEDIVTFIILMFIMVSIRVLSDWFRSHLSLSLTEMSVYLIFFTICIIRLLLGWRVSTFIPLEDTTLYVENTMRKSILDICLWMVAFIPLVVALSVEIWHCYRAKKWLKYTYKISSEISNYLSRSKKNYYVASLVEWCVKLRAKLSSGMSGYSLKINNYLLSSENCYYVFVGALVLCWACGHISYVNRLFNIPVPIVLFFIYELWLNNIEQQKVHNTSLYRFLAFLSVLGYVIIVDTGFSIIFLTYAILYYLVFESLFKNKKTYIHYMLCGISTVVLCLLLWFEGDILLFVFNIAGILSLVFSFIFSVVLIYLLIKYKIWCKNRCLNVFFKVVGAVIVICCISDLAKKPLGFTNEEPYIYQIANSIVNSKAHMRYRAEIQRLTNDEKIDDLIRNNEFESRDIVFILRSAHNQWFINQYIRAGHKLKDNNEFFHIQPHSNQGSTYTTQTTDLVATRYILAEHGECVIKWILCLWMVLIVLYGIEFKLSNRTNRLFLNGPMLIYVISVMVYLSATNRIVFFGQDFPMLSLQSKVTIIFPMLLLLLLIGRAIYMRSKERNDDKPEQGKARGIIFIVIVVLFTICMLFIEQKGKDQNDSQFNVSRLISDISNKVDIINEKFKDFQLENNKVLKGETIKDTWRKFTQEGGDYSKVFYDYYDSDSIDFFNSLLHYFEEKQLNKVDANQLIHLRRRNNICYLAVNKQHYFIPAITKNNEEWTGSIYASRVESELTFMKNGIKGGSNEGFNANVLSENVRKIVPDMPLMRFDKDWIKEHRPLYLIRSKQGNTNRSYFNIISDGFSVIGDVNNNQIATAINVGDVLSLYKKEIGDKTKLIYSDELIEKGTPYLVKNLLIDGRNRLFFPLGKKSMWAYNFGNLVKSVCSQNPLLKDTSIYLSLDYDLCESLFNKARGELKNKQIISKQAKDILENYLTTQIDGTNDKDDILKYDKDKNKLKIIDKKKNNVLENAVKLINNKLVKYKGSEDALTSALTDVLLWSPDFTAVAIDGDGHIRALCDYSHGRRIDPNNVSDLNKTISELYKDGTLGEERNIFGTKALQYMPSGPASSFKPIAYSAVTSQIKLNWESINLTNRGVHEARKIDAEKSGTYSCYGGVEVEGSEELRIEGASPINLDLYLTTSNNLYHSIIILLGAQSVQNAKSIMRPYSSNIEGKKAFPVFSYDGSLMCFNPKKWHDKPNNKFVDEHSLLTEGLYLNFNIKEYAPHQSQFDENILGVDPFIETLYNSTSQYRAWVFPEASTLNNVDRDVNVLKDGFNQVLLGAEPLKMTPLMMAVNASRLASLNSAPNIVTILDDKFKKDTTSFFRLGDKWTEDDYLVFMKRTVWKQMRAVPKVGTAKALNGLMKRMEEGRYGNGKPYFLYCKTGTLNDGRGNGNDRRIKPLLVFITDRPLENVGSKEALRKIRYYAVYLAFYGVENINAKPFEKYIEDILESKSFKDYMNK